MEGNPYQSPLVAVDKESPSRPIASWRMVLVGLILSPALLSVGLLMTCVIAEQIQPDLSLHREDYLAAFLAPYTSCFPVMAILAVSLRIRRSLQPERFIILSLSIYATLALFMLLLVLTDSSLGREVTVGLPLGLLGCVAMAMIPSCVFAAWIARCARNGDEVL